MSNRIKQAIINKAVELKQRLDDGIISQEQINELRTALDMNLEEYCKFQNLKSESFISNLLSLDEANYVYKLLGTTPETFNAQPVQIKIVLTQLFQELLGVKIKLMQAR